MSSFKRYFECLDCGAEVPVFYERNEFDPSRATGWCPKSSVAKTVLASEVKERRE